MTTVTLSDENVVDQIFLALDGITPIARALGVPIQTVHYWKAKGAIPRWRRPPVLQLALSKGTPLTAGALAYLGAAIAAEPERAPTEAA